jgi:hypothetical protein
MILNLYDFKIINVKAGENLFKILKLMLNSHESFVGKLLLEKRKLVKKKTDL